MTPILYLCKSPENGDAHWRVVSVANRLRQTGVDVRVCWLGPSEMPTEPVAGRVVVLQQVVVNGGPDAACAWTDRLRAAGALAVVCDFDDDELTGSNIDHLAATHPISASDRAELEQRCQSRIDTLRACDGATVSTEPLADVVRRYTDRPVIVCQNAIDIDWFRARLPARAPWADHVTIGWAGWRRPDADLEPMAEAWERIARRYPDVRFVVAGHQADAIYRRDIPLDRIIRLPIAPLNEYPPLHQVDIGCCAVADSPFSRCKSPIKAWEYATAGAAVLATPALYRGCVPLGLPMPSTADDWEFYLDLYVRSESNRTVNGAAWRQHIEQHHTLDGQLHRWTDAYASIVGTRAGVPV